jgi:hypothetical protein
MTPRTWTSSTGAGSSTTADFANPARRMFPCRAVLRSHRPQNPYRICQTHYEPVSEHGAGVTPLGYLTSIMPVGVPFSWTSGPSVQGIATRAHSAASTNVGQHCPQRRRQCPTPTQPRRGAACPASGTQVLHRPLRGPVPHPAVLAPSGLPGARMSIWGTPMLDNRQYLVRRPFRVVIRIS